MDEKREETRLIIRNKLQPSLVTLFQESKCPIRITSPPQRVARATLSLPQPHPSRETSVPELASRHVASNHPLLRTFLLSATLKSAALFLCNALNYSRP